MSLNFKEALNINKIKELKNKFKNISSKSSWFGFIFKSDNIVGVNFASVIGAFILGFIHLMFDNTFSLLLFYIPIISLLFFNPVYFLQKRRISKINLHSYMASKYICLDRFLNKNLINEINENLSNLNQKEKELLELMILKNSSDSPLLCGEYFLANKILENFLSKKTIKEIKEEKDVIFNYIRENITDDKTVDQFLSLLNSKLNEKTAEEKILEVENKFNEKNNDIQIENNSLAIKNI